MRIYLWIGFLFLLQGCAFSSSPTLQKESLSDYHNLVATDSKLRVITSSKTSFLSTTGLVDPHSIICTEPSPDVATTIANSFGIGASIFGQGSASLSAQQVEGLVQLGERTAAIQLLRDKMYQTCVAYANGAISGTTYSLLMSRLDDSIITLSLSDGAAGAFGRKLAGIGGDASAKTDSSLMGLPNVLSTIDDQAKKLAAANKEIDNAANALQSHNASQPVAGKEDDYKAETTKLEANLVNAKAERDALQQLMQSSTKSASEASGKISQLQTGGGLSPAPNAEILRDMQAEFLQTNIGRDLTYACMVELGLRGDPKTGEELKKLTQRLGDMFINKQDETSGTNYAGAVNRERNTLLTDFCKTNLKNLVEETAKQSHEYRMYRSKLSAEAVAARYSADTANSSAQDRKLFIDSINLCKDEFKDDTDRQKACLDQVIPIKAGQQPISPIRPPAKNKKSSAVSKGKPSGRKTKNPPATQPAK